MNLELIGFFAFIALIGAANLYLKWKASKTREDRFVWQPDLSHKVVVTEYETSRDKGGTQQTFTLVEKAPEERANYKRSYLKEKDK